MPAPWDPARWTRNEDGSYSRGAAVEEETFDATPGAVDAAAELGVNLADVTGTGKDGRITKGDVEAAVGA